MLLSRKKIESQIKWRELVENLDQEKVYECKVMKVIKGGVLSKRRDMTLLYRLLSCPSNMLRI